MVRDNQPIKIPGIQQLMIDKRTNHTERKMVVAEHTSVLKDEGALSRTSEGFIITEKGLERIEKLSKLLSP